MRARGAGANAGKAAAASGEHATLHFLRAYRHRPEHVWDAICAAGALLQYVRDTQKAAVPHIRGLQVEERTDALVIDAATRQGVVYGHGSSLWTGEQARAFAHMYATPGTIARAAAEPAE